MSLSDFPTTKGTGKSHVLKLEQETDQNKHLRDGLWMWHEEKVILQLRLCFYKDHGACMFMDDTVIKQIVLCAHHGGIIRADYGKCHGTTK